MSAVSGEKNQRDCENSPGNPGRTSEGHHGQHDSGGNVNLEKLLTEAVMGTVV